METLVEQNPRPFVERRGTGEARVGGPERRQFRATASARPEVAEFSAAVDAYKAQNHRRFITFEELLNVVLSLGYRKQS